MLFAHNKSEKMSSKNSIMYTSGYIWLGIFIFMFSITIINLIFKSMYGDQLIDGQMVAKELLIFGMVGFLLFYIIPKEKLNLESISLHNRHWIKSLLLVVGVIVVFIVLVLGCLELSKLLGWKFGESTGFDLLSKPVIAFITLRAGVAEEIFIRGFCWKDYQQ
jgi:membrane protease YdiL (CAAX protease family)